ncbi:hypothetical protein LJC64_04820, partial [Ruminococcaceae bacterium OttesenSCG-928-A11]|nr:hypothetical protein [Ruminococcaceae bacterium OttesenSCG-928-A11]
MDCHTRLDQLYGHAAGYRFGDFDALLKDLTPGSAGEALLLRAQIKLYATDPTFMDDLERAAAAGTEARLPCLGGAWPADC